MSEEQAPEPTRIYGLPQRPPHRDAYRIVADLITAEMALRTAHDFGVEITLELERIRDAMANAAAVEDGT